MFVTPDFPYANIMFCSYISNNRKVSILDVHIWAFLHLVLKLNLFEITIGFLWQK